jgi:acyl-coenzyme A synthetase/AMP-(fatty) acid ligase
MSIDRAPESVFFQRPSVWEAFSGAAQAYSARTAARMGQQVWTYEALWERADRIRRRLSTEVVSGPILFAPTTTLASLAFILGSIASDTVPLFADPKWTRAELDRTMQRCGARAFVEEVTALGDADKKDGSEDFRISSIAVAPGDTPSIEVISGTRFGRFTSGTTGFSRCLQFGDRAALAAAKNWRGAAGISADDRVLCLAGLHNGLAFNTSLLTVLLSGGLLAFHEGKMMPRALARTLRDLAPTIFVAFPFAYELLTREGAEALLPRGLRLAVSSAAPLAPAIRERWQRETGLAICDYYGLAEVGPCTFNDGSVPESVGTPLDGVDVLITDEHGQKLERGHVGRVRVKSPSMASGYLDAAEPRFESNLDDDGHYVTCDLGRLTPSGHLVLTGRAGRIVNIAGRKIDPTEVEAVIAELPGVTGVVVYGRQAAQRVVLVAVVESETITRDEVVMRCVERLAQYKLPQEVEIVPHLPRSSTGKVLPLKVLKNDPGPDLSRPSCRSPARLHRRADRGDASQVRRDVIPGHGPRLHGHALVPRRRRGRVRHRVARQRARRGVVVPGWHGRLRRGRASCTGRLRLASSAPKAGSAASSAGWPPGRGASSPSPVVAAAGRSRPDPRWLSTSRTAARCLPSSSSAMKRECLWSRARPV